MNLRRLAGHGILAEYGRTTPGEHNSVTRGNAIGVAFTPQRHAVWSVGSAHRLSGAIEPSSVFIAPKEGVAWTAWDLVSETVEVWLDRDDLSRLSHEHGGPSQIEFGFHDRIDDPVIVDIAARIRRLICAPFPSAERLTELGRELAGHYLRNYAGVKIRHGSIRPLDAVRFRRVVSYIDAHLHESITLDQLAGAAATSPFHFARTFKAATGASPHVFVVRRRMDRAAALFRTTDLTVAEVAVPQGSPACPISARTSGLIGRPGDSDFRKNGTFSPPAQARNLSRVGAATWVAVEEEGVSPCKSSPIHVASMGRLPPTAAGFSWRRGASRQRPRLPSGLVARAQTR